MHCISYLPCMLNSNFAVCDSAPIKLWELKVRSGFEHRDWRITRVLFIDYFKCKTLQEAGPKVAVNSRKHLMKAHDSIWSKITILLQKVIFDAPEHKIAV